MLAFYTYIMYIDPVVMCNAYIISVPSWGVCRKDWVWGNYDGFGWIWEKSGSDFGSNVLSEVASYNDSTVSYSSCLGPFQEYIYISQSVSPQFLLRVNFIVPITFFTLFNSTVFSQGSFQLFLLECLRPDSSGIFFFSQFQSIYFLSHSFRGEVQNLHGLLKNAL